MGKSALQESAMAARIHNREDNLYKKDMIKDILKMYSDELRKAILNGERVQITKVGTLIPEIKTHIGNYNLPVCNNEGVSPVYTRLRFHRSNSFGDAMNKRLRDNVEDGIYGLEKLPFAKQQMSILKADGYIMADVEDVDYEDYEDYEEED